MVSIKCFTQTNHGINKLLLSKWKQFLLCLLDCGQRIRLLKEISSFYHIYLTFVLSKYHGMLCFSIKTIVLSVSRY